MARSKRVKPEELPQVVGEILKTYAQDLDTGTDTVVTKVAKAGVEALKSASQATFKGNKYWRSWSYQVERKRIGTRCVIYSTMPGLPHLLEHGHASVHGGRVGKPVPGRTHIAPVAEMLDMEYVRQMEAMISDL